MRLSKKNALVTGGSRGIGSAICDAFAKEGANIAFTYVNQSSELNETKKKLSRYDVDIIDFQCDVRDRSKWKVILNKIEKKWGNLDILVNNAGINKPTDFDKITDADWDEIINVNLKGPFITSQEAFPLLSKSKSASIINVGSVSGQYGGPRTAHYAASKAGLISLSQVIARFGAGSGVRSNTIAAGLITSDMGAEGLKSEAVKKAAETIVLKRFGSFDDVAKTAVFLASDESNYITAQTLNVNGGLYF